MRITQPPRPGANHGLIEYQTIEAAFSRSRTALVDTPASQACIIRSLCPPHVVAELQTLVTEELVSYGASSGIREGGLAYELFESEEAINLTRFRSSETVLRTLPALVRPWAEAMLGDENPFQHPNVWVRAVPPDDGDYLASPLAHQDFVEIQGSVNCLTFWITVFDVDEYSGVLPTYQRPTPGRVLPLTLSSDSPNGWCVSSDSLIARRVPTLAAGDALCFDALTPHGGARNDSNNWRVSIEVRFQRMAEPLAETCLESYSESVLFDKHSKTPPTVKFNRLWEEWREVQALAQAENCDPACIRALEIVADESPRENHRKLAEHFLAEFDRAER